MIRLSEIIKKEGIILDLKSHEKVAVITELVDALKQIGLIDEAETFLSDILRRENLESTGIGLGVAIPHARTKSAKELMLTFGHSEKGVDFNSLDGKPSHLIFLIAAPEHEKSQYIMALARLSKILRKEGIRTMLNNADTPENVVEIIKGVE
jgi:fructose-specific phosphotransferase system IIA component